MKFNDMKKSPNNPNGIPLYSQPMSPSENKYIGLKTLLHLHAFKLPKVKDYTNNNLRKASTKFNWRKGVQRVGI